MRNATLNKSLRDNFGRQIENIAFIELLRRGYQVDVGSYNNTEIDFVAKKGAEIQYFQVATQLPENSNHEIDNLISQPDNYQKNRADSESNGRGGCGRREGGACGGLGGGN